MYRPTKKEKNKKEHLEEQLDVPKNSWFKKLKKTSLF